MAATVTLTNFGRTPTAIGSPALIPLTIAGNGAAYTNGTGLPIDLSAALNAAAPPDLPYINPADVVGLILQTGLSASGFLIGNFTLNPANATYGPPTSGPFSTANVASANVRPQQVLTSCPATFKVYGTGAANQAPFSEIATGANNDTFVCWLVIARNGANA
jgi:hypothetical protein